MSLIFRQPWTSQPQGPVGLSPEFASGVYGLGGKSSIGVNVTSFGGTSDGIGIAGTSVKNAGGTGRTLALPKDIGSNFTVVAIASFNALGTNQALVDRDNFGLSYRCFQLNKASGNAIDFTRFDTAGNPYFAVSTNVVTSTKTANIFIARSNGAAMTCWLNGAGMGTGTIVNTPKPLDSIIYLGGSASGGTSIPDNKRLNGDLFAWVILPFAISDGQAARIAANPWQLFAPVQSVSRTLSAIAAPVTDAMTGTILRSRKPWTSQPQGPVGIDWSNPLTRGLDSALLPAGGTGYDSVRGIFALWHYDASYHSVGVGAYGRTFLQNYIYDDIKIPNGTTPLISITAAAIISLRSFPLAQTHLYVVNSPSADASVSLRLNTDGTVSLYIFDYFGGSLLKAFTTTATVPIGIRSVVIGKVTKDFTVSIFINGVNVFTQLAAVSGFNYTPKLDAVGPRGYASPSYTASGPLSHYGLLSYKIALSDAEIKSLSDNPWQVFAPVQSVSRTAIAGAVTDVSITSATTNSADTSAGVITPIAQPSINPIYTRVADIQGGILLGNIATTISTGSAAADYTGQSQHNIPIFTADATNGGYVQKIRFKAAGTNVAAIAKIYLNEGKLNTVSPAGTPGTPTGAPSPSGGTLQPGSYYAKVQAIDSWGGFGILSAESAAVVITTTLGSIVWSWTAATGPVAYYRVYVGTVAGGEYSYFDTTTAALTYTQTVPFKAGKLANPIDNTTANMFIGEIVLPPSTASNVTPNIDIDYPINRALSPGYRILVGLHSTATLASGWVATVFGGKY